MRNKRMRVAELVLQRRLALLVPDDDGPVCDRSQPGRHAMRPLNGQTSDVPIVRQSVGDDDMPAALAPGQDIDAQGLPPIGRDVANLRHLKLIDVPTVEATVLTARQPCREDAPRISSVPI